LTSFVVHRFTALIRIDQSRTGKDKPTVLSTVVLMLQGSVSLSSVIVCTECIVAKWCGASYSKSYYWQPIGSRIWEIEWYQTEWPWPLFRGRIKVMSSARHIHRWISRKPATWKFSSSLRL